MIFWKYSYFSFFLKDVFTGGEILDWWVFFFFEKTIFLFLWLPCCPHHCPFPVVAASLLSAPASCSLVSGFISLTMMFLSVNLYLSHLKYLSWQAYWVKSQSSHHSRESVGHYFFKSPLPAPIWASLPSKGPTWGVDGFLISHRPWGYWLFLGLFFSVLWCFCLQSVQERNTGGP